MRSLATSSVSRVKKPGPSTCPAGRDLSANTCDYMNRCALMVRTIEIIDEELNDHGHRHHDLARQDRGNPGRPSRNTASAPVSDDCQREPAPPWAGLCRPGMDA